MGRACRRTLGNEPATRVRPPSCAGVPLCQRGDAAARVHACSRRSCHRDVMRNELDIAVAALANAPSSDLRKGLACDPPSQAKSSTTLGVNTTCATTLGRSSVVPRSLKPYCDGPGLCGGGTCDGPGSCGGGARACDGPGSCGGAAGGAACSAARRAAFCSPSDKTRSVKGRKCEVVAVAATRAAVAREGSVLSQHRHQPEVRLHELVVAPLENEHVSVSNEHAQPSGTSNHLLESAAPNARFAWGGGGGASASLGAPALPAARSGCLCDLRPTAR